MINILFRFSQKNISKEKQEHIKKLWKFVQTRGAKDLCIKVMFYSDKYGSHYRGNYRNFYHHGFYDKEWKELYSKYNVTHIITLKIGQTTKDEDVVYLMAHEWRHYLQWHNGTLTKKYFRKEPDATKYGRKRKELFIAKNK